MAKNSNIPVHYEIHTAPISDGRTRLEVVFFPFSDQQGKPISRFTGLPYDPVSCSASNYPDVGAKSPAVKIVGEVDWIDKLKGRNTHAAKVAIATHELSRWAERQIQEGVLKLGPIVMEYFETQRSRHAATRQVLESDSQGN